MSGSDLLTRFRDAVRRDPERTAVRDTAGALSFAALDRRTAALAEALRGYGIGRGDRVGVCLPRGTDLLVAMLAVWRAGAAYVPLDPAYPADRLAFMADDARLGALVTASRPAWLSADVPAIAVTDSAADSPAGPAFVDAEVTGLDPAYLIYTSGSTGRPKGVLVPRGAVAALVTALERAGMYAAAPRVVAWNASASFDASVQQWARVCRGDSVVVLEQEHRTEPERLAAWLAECAVTDLDLTPSHWDLLRERLLSTERPLRLFIGGEPIREPVWREIADAAAEGRLDAVNVYGPTECTVDATATWIAGPGGPHIGTALTGVDTHVLDEHLGAVPVGEPGELYLSGPRVALGYLGRPGLTAQRFVPAVTGVPGARMYRTGDRVRRRADGVLEFLGRADGQVKLRGYRVELGEIEAALRACAGVSAAAVVLRELPGRGTQLVGYHVSTVPAATLRAALAETLPEYMLPGDLVRLAALPLTANGKLDPAALPDPTTEDDTDGGAGDDAPMGAVAQVIAEVWAEVLGRDRVGADDDFFALGGHSLVALRAVARLKRTFGVAISTRDVYRHPRLSELARHVEELAGARGEALTAG
ncbi:amino acid adenylation domain-containing protein [Krasilnikovia cinnamomea]|uniref:Amino acid adenylation domain-containing protein n=1 Tax=Krasilnikovia cinnamomea TaxID=349313 RepID=A0A4Q7ZQG2_9ACTN|nr:non-ribosomal peptide synthetase [Krasilnikovia cinnamomea]RZU53362.1 amino acid adenylation domain-containing protein [Krasilnikovia cinnamomea]